MSDDYAKKLLSAAEVEGSKAGLQAVWNAGFDSRNTEVLALRAQVATLTAEATRLREALATEEESLAIGAALEIVVDHYGAEVQNSDPTAGVEFDVSEAIRAAEDALDSIQRRRAALAPTPEKETP